MSSEKSIGLDVHQATISVAVMDSQGKVVMESILETKASTLLESDYRTVQKIGDAVSYQDVSFFRQLFQRHTGVSPRRLPAEVRGDAAQVILNLTPLEQAYMAWAQIKRP
jgi:AraC-like DNA-binding protein